jgi:hypothetical protein
MIMTSAAKAFFHSLCLVLAGCRRRRQYKKVAAFWKKRRKNFCSIEVYGVEIAQDKGSLPSFWWIDFRAAKH